MSSGNVHVHGFMFMDDDPWIDVQVSRFVRFEVSRFQGFEVWRSVSLHRLMISGVRHCTAAADEYWVGQLDGGEAAEEQRVPEVACN
jgi:hypothetical protein